MFEVVLVRHGESVWNKENRFTGWTDVSLSKKGIMEAHQAGQRLKEKGYLFDLAFTSKLKRAQETLKIILDELDLKIPIQTSWRLNERHYGALQGLNKDEMKKKYSPKKVHLWRRSYDVPPPPNKEGLGESLKDTEKRVLPYWQEEILPQIKAQRKVIIVAHGNSLRALIKNLQNLSATEIVGLEIPTGKPLFYQVK